MDDTRSNALAAAETYRCPGESYTIDRAVHLGRLASFYPACRHCERKHETHSLTASQLVGSEQLALGARPGLAFRAEGIERQSAGGFEPGDVRRIATALAVTLWRKADAEPPRVLVGADGSWTAAEPLSEACHVLARCGCQAIEIGATTTANLTTLAHGQRASAALWLGNASGEPHTIGARFWGAAGRPWSSPGSLDEVRRLFDHDPSRPKRQGGGLARGTGNYLAGLTPLFHALRPLRFVVDTRCAPLLRYVNQLLSTTACDVVHAVEPDDRTREDAPAAETYGGRRLRLVGRQVVERSAHFGAWIDGAGETLRLVDERGAAVPAETLFALVAGYVRQQNAEAAIVVARDAGKAARRALAGAGRMARCPSTRQAVSAAMAKSGALFGLGPGDRLWYADQVPTADALMTLSLLLVVLSQSDRACSEVLGPAA